MPESADLYSALDELDVELSAGEKRLLDGYLAESPNAKPRIRPDIFKAILVGLHTLAEQPGGVSRLTRMDLRNVITPTYGVDYIQRLNQDEGLFLNDLQNAIHRHLRESGKVPFTRPISKENPVTQPNLTVDETNPSVGGAFDYNRRGVSSVIPTIVEADSGEPAKGETVPA